MNQNDISPEIKKQLENFLVDVENYNFSNGIEPFETFTIQPILISEFLLDNGYSEDWSDSDDESIKFDFTKENPNFNDDEDSLEFFTIRMEIMYWHNTTELSTIEA